jgi:hypothetical protein
MVVPFKNEWISGDGTLANATEEPVPQGKIRIFVDPTGRKAMLIGTVAGTIVVYNKYPGNNEIVVCNLPNGFDLGITEMREDDLNFFASLATEEELCPFKAKALYYMWKLEDGRIGDYDYDLETLMNKKDIVPRWSEELDELDIERLIRAYSSAR